MRILQFYKTAFPDTMGGVEQVIHQLARGMNHRGVNTEVLALSSKASAATLEMEGYSLHRARLNFHIASTGFSWSAFSKFSQLAQKADLIHYHFPWPFMDVVHFATRIKKPALVTYHSDIIRQKYLLKLYRPLQMRFLKSMHCIVATSPNYCLSSPILQRFNKKVQVIPIGLEKNSYAKAAPERVAYWQTCLGKRFFLFIGVFRYYKGLHNLLAAAQKINVPIALIGAGPLEDELKKQAAHLPHVHFLGYQSEEEKAALLQACYGLVFPSHLRTEAFGISLLEGAMYGKPMISSEIGTGTTYINLANETGVVIPPNDPHILAEAMKFLWENPDKAATMGMNAEKRYWELFTAEQMVQDYIKVYEGILCSSAVSAR